MDTLLHLPLEHYRARYTEFLSEWEQAAFSEDFKVETIEPQHQNSSVVLDINKGEVLDSIARPAWAMQQVQMLLSRGGTPDLGRAYVSDFYLPGLDAIRYSRRPCRLSSFLWAQTFDRFDFTTQFMSWMRPWEIMAFSIYEAVFVASDLLFDLITSALPDFAPKIHVVGLPFNSSHVSNLWDKKKVPEEKFDVVYTSRWDKEKNPAFFLQLVKMLPNVKFAVCTGHPSLRGSDSAAVLEALKLQSQGKLQIFTNLTKGEYYSILSRCRVQFNCGLQDWVSFTLLEALTYKCLPLYPNHRSFPDALNHHQEFLYRPFDIRDAQLKLQNLLAKPDNFAFPDASEVLEYHNNTLYRISDILQSI